MSKSLTLNITPRCRIADGSGEVVGRRLTAAVSNVDILTLSVVDGDWTAANRQDHVVAADWSYVDSVRSNFDSVDIRRVIVDCVFAVSVRIDESISVAAAIEFIAWINQLYKTIWSYLTINLILWQQNIIL